MIALKNVLSRLTTKKEGDIEVVNVIPEDGNEIYLPQTGDLLDMEKQYRQIMFFYEAGIQQVTAKLEILNKEFQYCNDRNPIENIKSRVKSADSIIEKMKKKGLPLTISCMMGNIHDIAGVRVICPFITDVYHVAAMLMNQTDVEVIFVPLLYFVTGTMFLPVRYHADYFSRLFLISKPTIVYCSRDHVFPLFILLLLNKFYRLLFRSHNGGFVVVP